MRKLILCAIAVMLMNMVLYAQPRGTVIKNNTKDTISSIKQLMQGKIGGLAITKNNVASKQFVHPPLPAFVINGKVVGRNNMCINPDDILTINNLWNDKDSAATKKYGLEARGGAIEIMIKPDVKLLNLEEVLDKFNVPKEQQGLPVKLNNKIITNPQTFVATADGVQAVHIVDKNILIYSANTIFEAKGLKEFENNPIRAICIISRQSFFQKIAKN